LLSRETGGLVTATLPETSIGANNPPSLFIPERTTPTPPPPSPPAASTPEPENNDLPPAVARLQNILEKDASWILKAAHVASIYDSENTRVSSYNGTNAELIQDIYWHGAVLGTPYHTTFRFSVTCGNPEVIDDISIATTDINNPPAAFLVQLY
jgi:hypothetical protein